MILIKKDVTDAVETPKLKIKSFQDNGDGTVSLLMPDGTFAYQQPNLYGQFGFDASPSGAYQRAKLNGQLVTFWTRPQDQTFTYTWVDLPNS